MKQTRIIQNLALIGFMGSGKSSVGRMAAVQMGFDFLDTDEAIEARTGRSIIQIFADEGEPAFREQERQLLEELAMRRGLVIATGGGLAANVAHLESLKSHALVICLWASPETIWQRVRHQTHRPLLETADPEARICQLLEEREPYYRQADILVSTEFRSLKEVAQQVLHQFHAARRS